MMQLAARLAKPTELQRWRWAVLTNTAAITETGSWVVAELLRDGVQVRKILAPEHGFTSQGPDGAFQPAAREAYSQLPIVSLYGDHFEPVAADLHDVDAVLVDLSNLGCRFYTYWWTITYVMEACARYHKPLVLLDRPSWRTGCATEGPILAPDCASFLGRWPMPITHSFTYGELAHHFNQKRNLKVDLRVVPAFGQVPFVPPSPSISTEETIFIYPATGLLEGVNVSEGRGTAFPFRVIGAPWLQAEELQAAVAAWQIPGLRSFAFRFQPTWGLYANTTCAGLYFTVTDRIEFRPVAFGIRLLNYIATRYPQHVQTRPYPTVANPTGHHHLDRLLGIPNAFEKICLSGALTDAAIREITHVAPNSW
jgi:uncharacterized protein YbbC (DUF1343 family)